MDAARRFYDAFFAPLGHANAWNQPGEMAYGPKGESRLFFIYPVTGEQVAGLGTHIAFSGDFLWDRAAALPLGRRDLNLGRRFRGVA